MKKTFEELFDQYLALLYRHKSLYNILAEDKQNKEAQIEMDKIAKEIEEIKKYILIEQ